MKDVKVSPVLLLIALLAAATSARAADILGTITLKGTPQTETDHPPHQRTIADCAAMYGKKMPTTHFFVVGSTGEFADVVVSLKGVAGKSTGASAPPVVLDQKGCVYTPSNPRHPDRPETGRQKFRQLHPQRPLHARRGRQ